MRANDFIESQSFDELLSNAKNVEDTSRQRRKDLSQQAEMVRVKNEENAMTRGLSPESANVQRVQRMQTKQEIKALNDVERDRSTQISNLIQRRDGQLAQRGSEMILAIRSNVDVLLIFDNSNTYMTGALISSVGSIAGGIYGYGKYSGGFQFQTWVQAVNTSIPKTI